jgi:hypothetical protein
MPLRPYVSALCDLAATWWFTNLGQNVYIAAHNYSNTPKGCLVFMWNYQKIPGLLTISSVQYAGYTFERC